MASHQPRSNRSSSSRCPSRGNLADMATDKRDRQRANREEKKAAEAKAAARKARFDIVKRYAIYTAIFAVAILLLFFFTN